MKKILAKKNILLLLTSTTNVGGIERFNNYFISALRDTLNDKKIKIICYGRYKFISKAIYLFRALFASLKSPEFVICGHINIGLVAYIIHRLFGIEYVVIAHGIEVWDLTCGIKYRALKNARTVIAVSNYTKNRMINNGIPGKNIVILPNTYDESIFRPRQKNIKLIKRFRLENKKVLLTVSRIDLSEKYKGHSIVLRALKRLDESFVWLVVGDGTGLSGLKNEVDRSGISDRVYFVGKKVGRELAEYFNLCDVFVMPSKKEGFGIVFLEAMACGKPVIAGNKDGSVDPLDNGRLGFLVNPDKPQEVALAIRSAIRKRINKTSEMFLSSNTKKMFGRKSFIRRVHNIFNHFQKL